MSPRNEFLNNELPLSPIEVVDDPNLEVSLVEQAPEEAVAPPLADRRHIAGTPAKSSPPED